MPFSEIVKLQFDKKKCHILLCIFFTFENYCFLIISKNAWLPPIFFLYSNSPCLDLLFPHGIELPKNTSFEQPGLGMVLVAQSKPCTPDNSIIRVLLVSFQVAYHNMFNIWQVLAGHEGPISGLMFSPSHPLLVSGSWDRTVRLWHMFDSKVSWETLNLGSDGLHCFWDCKCKFRRIK